jgi:trimethylamine--corrinoid protein Co-methyltransferase
MFCLGAKVPHNFPRYPGAFPESGRPYLWSLEMIVMLNEIIDQARRLCRGIPVNDDMLAIDIIREVGANGNFLIHPHTLKHVRSTQWRPKLISRMGFDQWQSTGSTSLLGRAQKKLQQILEEHQPFPIPEDQAQEIQKRVDQFI